MNEKVSIIVAAYNEEKNIRNCVMTLINQTYSNIEIIVIDDGSIDDTWNILTQLQEEHEIIIYRQSNKGVSSARNKGIELSNGEWIAFSDADDYYEPDAIDRLINGNICNCDIVQGVMKRSSLKYVDSGDFFVVNNSIIEKILFNYETELDEEEYGFLSKEMRFSIHGPYGKIIRRSLIINNHIIFNTDLKLGEDLLFYLECLLQVPNVGLLYKTVYVINENMNSTTRRYNPELPVYALKFINQASKLICANNLENLLKEDLNYQIYMHYYVAVKCYFSVFNNFKEMQRKVNELRNFVRENHIKNCIAYRIHQPYINGIDKCLLWFLSHNMMNIYLLLFNERRRINLRKAVYEKKKDGDKCYIKYG